MHTSRPWLWPVLNPQLSINSTSQKCFPPPPLFPPKYGLDKFSKFFSTNQGSSGQSKHQSRWRTLFHRDWHPACPNHTIHWAIFLAIIVRIKRNTTSNVHVLDASSEACYAEFWTRKKPKTSNGTVNTLKYTCNLLACRATDSEYRKGDTVAKPGSHFTQVMGNTSYKLNFDLGKKNKIHRHR